jgi:hypothetical protein
MSTFEATLQHLPKPILDKLRAIIGRVRRLLFIRGFFATLSVGLACLLIIMGIDATVTLFSSAARWALSLTGLAITVATAWWFLIRPLSRKITLTHIARILEIRHPELQERISTAVELMSSKDPESVKGSQELIAAVVDSAVVDVNQVDPKTEFKGGRASRFMMVGGVAAAIFLLLFAIWPRHIGVLAARAFAPFLDIGNAWSDTIEVKPGDVRIAIGQSVTVEMTVRHDKLRRAEIRTKQPDGTESIERMTLMGTTPEGANRFSITFPAVADTFDYRIRAGSAVSKFYTVEAVPKPVVERLTLRYDFPAYTNREPVEAVSDTGEIVALAHTAVTVTAELNKPATEAGLKVVGLPLETQPVIEGNQVKWQFPLAPKTESRWRMNFKDADGFESDPTDYPITALPDRAPQVKIVTPTFRELRLRPTEMLPIHYAVTEDIGVGEVALLVTPESEVASREIAQPTPESDGQPGTWRGVASLNLASLKLQPNQTRLTVMVRARDTLPAEYQGPNEGLSEKLTIIIDAGAKSLAEQTLAAQKQEIRKAIEEAKQELSQAKNEAQQAERELAKEDKVSTQAMRELDEFREKANEAQETLREVAKKTEQTVFQPQGEQLEKVADQQVADAREAADMIPLSDKKDERIAEAKTAQKQVDQAIEELKKIEKTLNDSDDEMRLVAELNDLANKQRQLAQTADQKAEESAAKEQQLAQSPPNEQAQQQLTEEQKRQMEEFRREQEKIQRELGEKLAKSPEALRDILAKQQELAAQLAEQAKAAAQEQQQLQKMTETAAKAEPNQQEALREQLLASLEQRQQRIAEETSALKEQLDQQQADAGKPLQAASQQTQKAAETLKQEGNGAQAASEAAKQAAAALNEAKEQAESMAAQDPSQPAANPEGGALAAEAGKPEMAQAQTPAQPEPNAPQAQAPKGAESQPETAPNPAAPQPQGQDPGAPQPQMAKAQAKPEGTQPQGDQPAAASEPQKSSEAAKAESAQAQAQTPAPGQPQDPSAGDSAPESPAMAQTPAGQQPGADQPQAPAPLAAEPTRQQLAQLAQQQEMIAQQLEAIEAGQLDEALAQMEQQVAQEAAALTQQADALENATAAAKQQNAASLANRAEAALASATQQAQQATQQLAQAQQARNEAQQQGQPASPQAQQALNQSRGQQQNAERSMTQAAQALQQTSETLAKSLQNMKAAPEQQSDVLDPQNLSQAFDDTNQSSRSQDAQQAAQNSQQAAESLQQLAQAAMDQLSSKQPGGQQPNQPGQQPNTQPQFADGADPQLNETGMKTADLNGDGIPPELKALGITAADWARLKGNLQSGGAAQGGDDLPAEYRDLVGRYFQVIAREAGKTK